jgi:hypothetical protein
VLDLQRRVGNRTVTGLLAGGGAGGAAALPTAVRTATGSVQRTAVTSGEVVQRNTRSKSKGKGKGKGKGRGGNRGGKKGQQGQQRGQGGTSTTPLSSTPLSSTSPPSTSPPSTSPPSTSPPSTPPSSFAREPMSFWDPSRSWGEYLGQFAENLGGGLGWKTDGPIGTSEEPDVRGWAREEETEDHYFAGTAPVKETDPKKLAEAKQKEFVEQLLDIPKIEIVFNPADLEGTTFGGYVKTKTSRQGSVSVGPKGAKVAGKVELTRGQDGKLYDGAMGPALIAGDWVESASSIEGFAGLKGGGEGEAQFDSEGVGIKGKLAAFAGLEAATKTEIVLKAGRVELGRFKGGLVLAMGVGGEISGTLKWPWGGDLEVTAKLKGSIGLGGGIDVDFKLPVGTMTQWLLRTGWEWTKWLAGY